VVSGALAARRDACGDGASVERRLPAPDIGGIFLFIEAGWGKPAPIATPLDTYWLFRNETAFDPEDD